MLPPVQKANVYGGLPIHTDIPKAIALFREKQFDEAGKLLFDNNPMSLVCTIVRNHEGQCTGHCILNKKGQPVQFSAVIKQYISEEWFENGEIACAPHKGIPVAVIGSSPSWAPPPSPACTPRVMW